MATTIYREGSRGAVVKLIQKAVGCYPDGIWGRLTTESVKAWQRDHGLTADGLAGPRTLAAMGIDAAMGAVTPSKKEYTIRHGGIVLKRSRREIDLIVVHCTASREGHDVSVEQIRREHRSQGWSDIGYHYVVTLDGEAHIGRDVDIAGSHVAGHNARSVGIAYVGGLENRPGVNYSQLKAKDTRTQAQKAELFALLMDLRRLYPNARIVGHRDLSPDKNGDGIISPCEWVKQCPSFDARKEYRSI